MLSFGSDSHYQWKILHPTGVYCAEDKSLVIFDCLDGSYYSLENRATVIWKLLELGLSIHQMMAYFEKDLHPEIYHLVKALEGRGLISPDPTTCEHSLESIDSEAQSIMESCELGSICHTEHSSESVMQLIEDRAAEDDFIEMPIPGL